MLEFIDFSPEQKPNRNTVAEVMQKDDSKSQARTAADSEQNDENLFVSQHNAKPLVVGSQSHGALKELLPDDERIVAIEKVLLGLTIDDVQYLLRKVNKYLTSKPLVVSA